MGMRLLDRYRCDECGFEAEVTHPSIATSPSDETLCCCGRCGAEMESRAAADERLNPRMAQAAPAA
jgi:predicted nucleic acid-binding Zn ribbon protein